MYPHFWWRNDRSNGLIPISGRERVRNPVHAAAPPRETFLPLSWTIFQCNAWYLINYPYLSRVTSREFARFLRPISLHRVYDKSPRCSPTVFPFSSTRRSSLTIIQKLINVPSVILRFWFIESLRWNSTLPNNTILIRRARARSRNSDRWFIDRAFAREKIASCEPVRSRNYDELRFWSLHAGDEVPHRDPVRRGGRSSESPLHIRGIDLHIKRYCFSYGIGRVSGFTFYIGVQVRREAATVPDIRPI